MQWCVHYDFWSKLQSRTEFYKHENIKELLIYIEGPTKPLYQMDLTESVIIWMLLKLEQSIFWVYISIHMNTYVYTYIT